jgi:hypothetical protein
MIKPLVEAGVAMMLGVESGTGTGLAAGEGVASAARVRARW